MKAEHLDEATKLVEWIKTHKANIKAYNGADTINTHICGKFIFYDESMEGFAEMKLALIAIEEQSIAQLTKRADQIGLHI